MEYLRGENQDEDKSPDSAGEAKPSKKTRKKVTKIPKAVVLGQEEKQPKQLADKKPSDAAETTAKQGREVLPELELPEVEVQEGGELIIDHSDEQKPAEEALEPEQELDIAVNQEAEIAGEVADVEPDLPEPPRVAPPLLFEFPPELLRRPEEAPIPPVSQPEADHHSTAADNVPPIPLHELHPAGRERMFDPSQQAAEPAVPESEARRREHRARKQGTSSGVVAGGVAGFLFGNWRGKRVTRVKLRPEIAQRDKTIEGLDEQLRQRDETISRLARERDHEDAAQKDRTSVFARMQAEFETLKKQTWEQKVLGRKEPELKPSPETASIVASPPLPETARPVFEPAPDSLRSSRAVKAESPPELTLPIEEQRVTEELYTVPAGHRVETSAWHRIEVDEATGKAVEAPTVAYGEAFAREQKQEKLARDAAKAQTAAQVGMTLLSSGTQPSPHPTVSMTDSYSPAPPVRENKPVSQFMRENLPYIRRQLVQRTTSPVTWAISAGAVLLLVLTGVL